MWHREQVPSWLSAIHKHVSFILTPLLLVSKPLYNVHHCSVQCNQRAVSIIALLVELYEGIINQYSKLTERFIDHNVLTVTVMVSVDWCQVTPQQLNFI